MVSHLDLMVHYHHVDHHAHNRNTEHQANKERPPPSGGKQHNYATALLKMYYKIQTKILLIKKNKKINNYYARIIIYN